MKINEDSRDEEEERERDGEEEHSECTSLAISSVLQSLNGLLRWKSTFSTMFLLNYILKRRQWLPPYRHICLQRLFSYRWILPMTLLVRHSVLHLYIHMYNV